MKKLLLTLVTLLPLVGCESSGQDLSAMEAGLNTVEANATAVLTSTTLNMAATNEQRLDVALLRVVYVANSDLNETSTGMLNVVLTNGNSDCLYIKSLGEIGYTLGTNYSKEKNMSYARINMVEFNSAEDAVVSAGDYAENAAAEFPEAEILLSVATGNESAVLISVYPDKDAFERSAAARATRLEANQNRIKGVEMHEGEVTLCHCDCC